MFKSKADLLQQSFTLYLAEPRGSFKSRGNWPSNSIEPRANNLGDASVLPDLSASHRKQLAIMIENYSQWRDITRRCTRTTEELSVNIYQRQKWMMYVEEKMMVKDGKLAMYHENLKRLRRHLEVLLQIHLVPQMDISAVSELVRRRTFSQSFLALASNLSCQLLTVYNEEITRCREFQSKFDENFFWTPYSRVWSMFRLILLLKRQLFLIMDSLSLTSLTTSEENHMNKIMKEDDSTTLMSGDVSATKKTSEHISLGDLIMNKKIKIKKDG
uniref:Uncharacterized protein n=1 Tax=Glyptapanteles indiensis TaxID=92994 RepID=B7S8X5_GLYIN|nr:conserved hypothetical protein [Glyptapanteles indiensis]